MAAKKENRKTVAGMLLGIAFTSLLTGITEPIEFLFMFLAPVLYLLHALFTGAALAISAALGIKCGFGFSAGLIDYVLGFGISKNPLLMIPIGLVFGVIYYFVFLIFIKKFNLPTPGRIDEEESVSLSKLQSSKLKERAIEILTALGGKENLTQLDACITRIRVTVKDAGKVNEPKLKELGATAVLKMPGNNFQVVVGTAADPLVTLMKQLTV